MNEEREKQDGVDAELEVLEQLGIADEAQTTQEEALQPEETAPPDGGLCAKCGSAPRVSVNGVESPLCETCREKAVKLHFPVWLTAMLSVVLVLFACACAWLPTQLKSYRTYLNADRAFSEKRFYDAQQGYGNLLKKYPRSLPLAVKLLDAQMGHGDYQAAIDNVNQNLLKQNLSDSQYDKVTAHTKRLTLYSETMDALGQGLDAVTTKDPAAYAAAAMKVVDGMLASGKEYDRGLLYFYQGLYAASVDKSMSLYEKCISEDPANLYAYAILGNAFRSQNKLPEAEKYYDEALALDATDAGSLRGKSVLRLLEGKADEGLALALESYRIDPTYPYIRETVIIAYDQAGQRDRAEAFRKETDAASDKIDPQIDDYLSGKLSLRDYYIY